MSYLEDTATGGQAVTPADATLLDPVARALYIGGIGDVSIITADGDALIFVGVQAGSILPVQCSVVNATGTTATSIVSLYSSTNQKDA